MLKLKFVFAACAVFLFAWVLDLAFMRIVFALPNASGWDAFRWYNFERQMRRLGAREQDDRPLVLVVGSSIAQYSVQKEILEKALERENIRARVELLVHASMVPTDLRFYLTRIRDIRPDVILYITNPADLDLERYTPPWEWGPEYNDSAQREYLSVRVPATVIYPGAFGAEASDLSLEKRAGLLLRGAFGTLRFRKDWWEAVRFSRRAGSEKLRSYLNYQGVEIREGLWREGLTGACFTIPGGAAADGFLFESPKPLAAAGLHLDFYTERPTDGTCKARGSPVFTYNAGAVGWREVSLPPGPAARPLFVRLSHVLVEKNVIGVDDNARPHAGRGVRLPGNFGLHKLRENDAYVRRRSLEDERIKRMPEREYLRDLDLRVQPDHWRNEPALRQLNMLRIGKYYAAAAEFRETPQVREIQEIVRRSDFTKLVIINNPEHPETLAEYGHSRWYQGYKAFLVDLENRGRGRVKTESLEIAPAGVRFSDPHHLTYDGMVLMAPRYAHVIAPLLK